MLTCFVVTVSVYCTFYCLFTSIFFPWISFSFFFLLLVFWCCWKQDRRERSVWPTSWFLELRQPIKWAGFSFSFSAGFPCCCYVPASSLTSSAKFCVEASVNTFRCGNTNSIARKCTYSSHEKSIMARGQNDSVFININIYWVWQPSDCYMHFLGKLEDLYGSSFSTL